MKNKNIDKNYQVYPIFLLLLFLRVYLSNHCILPELNFEDFGSFFINLGDAYHYLKKKKKEINNN